MHGLNNTSDLWIDVARKSRHFACRFSANCFPGNMQPALITAPGAACRFRLAFGGRLETRCRSWLSPSFARLQRSAADPTIKVVYLVPKSYQFFVHRCFRVC